MPSHCLFELASPSGHLQQYSSTFFLLYLRSLKLRILSLRLSFFASICLHVISSGCREFLEDKTNSLCLSLNQENHVSRLMHAQRRIQPIRTQSQSGCQKTLIVSKCRCLNPMTSRVGRLVRVVKSPQSLSLARSLHLPLPLLLHDSILHTHQDTFFRLHYIVIASL